MANLATIGVTGGTASLAPTSASFSAMPNNGDTVIVGTEIFVFHRDRATANANRFVWTGLDPSQSMENLSQAINDANRGYAQRPVASAAWTKLDPKYSGDVHYYGNVSGSGYPFYVANGISTVSGSVSGSNAVIVAAFPNGF